MKKKILVLSGGISKERLISLDTGFQVAKELKKNGYRVKICEPNSNLTNNIKIFKPNIIFTHTDKDLNSDHKTINKSVLVATRPVQSKIKIDVIYSFEILSTLQMTLKHMSFPLRL